MESLGVFHSMLNHWENSLQHFRTDGITSDLPEFAVLFDPPTSSKYTWHEQCRTISCMPNNHYWQEGDHAHVGFSRMLSVRDSTGKYKPTSLRNLVLFHHRESNYQAIFNLINKFRNPESSSSSITVDKSEPNLNHPADDIIIMPRQRSIRPKRKPLTEEDILRNIRQVNPHFTAQNRASESSLFDQYKTSQVETGKLFWRIHKPDLDVVCMNDVSMNNGAFLDSSYIHLSRLIQANELKYQCTCSLYTTLIQLATLNDQDVEVDTANIRCCHIRFFQEVIEPDYEIYFSNHSFQQPTKSQNAILEAIRFLETTVCSLPSSLRTKKFSVVPKDKRNCRFVNYSKNRLACQSGECSSIYGFSTRKTLYLDKTENLCPHLEAMKENKDVWLGGNNIVYEEEEEEEDINLEMDNDEDDDIEELLQNPADITNGQVYDL